jgi:hypothetical protein
MAMYSAQPNQPVHHIENIGRGALVALLIVPVGIAAWIVLWQVGVVASIVSFGIAIGAVFLYRLGSGGAVSRMGAICIILITAVTVLLAIFGGIVSDVAVGLGQYLGISPFEALNEPKFWDVFGGYVSDPQQQSDLALPVILGLAFGVLGCFSTLRNALRATAANEAAQAATPVDYKPVNPEDQTKN